MNWHFLSSLSLISLKPSCCDVPLLIFSEDSTSLFKFSLKCLSQQITLIDSYQNSLSPQKARIFFSRLLSVCGMETKLRRDFLFLEDQPSGQEHRRAPFSQRKDCQWLSSTGMRREAGYIPQSQS